MPPAVHPVFLLVFIAFPIIELVILVKVAGMIGFWATLGIVLGTAILGITILNRQGLSTMKRASDAMAKGQTPFAHMTDGALLLFAGGLLLAPGLITDTLGLLLLIPPIRYLIIKWGFSKLQPASPFNASRDRQGRESFDNNSGPVIEGEFERIDEKNSTKPQRQNPAIDH